MSDVRVRVILPSGKEIGRWVTTEQGEHRPEGLGTYGVVADEECPANLVKLVGAEQVAVLNLDDGSIVVREPTERERFQAATGLTPPAVVGPSSPTSSPTREG